MFDDDKIRALLIEMRIYVTHHGVTIGECVAWNKLKAMYFVGMNDEREREWLQEYRKEHGGRTI